MCIFTQLDPNDLAEFTKMSEMAVCEDCVSVLFGPRFNLQAIQPKLLRI